MFAKLFETEDLGQLLVVRQTNDVSDPEMRAYCEPPGLGVCSVAVAWKDTEEGWNQQEATFAKCDEAMARKMTECIFEQAAEMAEED